MANPFGNIAGITDPSVPGWQDRVMAALAEREANGRTRTARQRRGHVQINCDEGYAILLNKAAQVRGVAQTTYARRAIAAFVAHDLGIPIGEVLAFVSAPVPYGGHASPGERTADDGAGYGSWQVR